MLGRRNSPLRELIRTQHEEFMLYQVKRDEESRKRDEEFRRRDEEMREFNREILLRNEKVYKAVIAEMEEGRKQIQANTRAVLSMLDRLDNAA
jgi:mevalonate kinase